MTGLPRWLFLPALVSELSLFAAPVLGHALGGSAVETRFTFPPWMVWAAGAFVVALSFGIVGGFLTRTGLPGRPGTTTDRPEDKDQPQPGLIPLRILGLAVLALVVANAFRPGSGSIFPQSVLWLVVWALLPILAYTLGTGWEAVSPFAALRPLATTARGGRAPRTYPERLGAWPSVVLLLALTGLEVSGHPLGHTAAPLALLVLAYVLLTLVGMTLYGDRWLDEAEVFTRMFRWWRAAAPVEWREGRLHWRGLTRGLERLPVHTTADVAFTIGILFGVNFDAFLATPLGASALDHLEDFRIPFPHVTLLITGFLVFLIVWAWAARAMRRAAESLAAVRRVAALFVASLLPIAVGYHLAHNLFMVIEQAPRLLVAALDPLGLGWADTLALPERLVFPQQLLAVLGTAQVAMILVGHVVAVVVAHHLAFHSFPSRLQAVRSEVPLTLVMVAYTWTGLWLLSSAHTGGVA